MNNGIKNGKYKEWKMENKILKKSESIFSVSNCLYVSFLKWY